jgi:uncharacterized repeat protein (TIGR03803 family)
MFLAALAILLVGAGAAQATVYYTLYSFKGSPDGAQPTGAVVVDKNGALYGTTYIGGTSVLGTVYKLTPATKVPWNETVLHSFNGSDGEYPRGSLVFGFEGVALYGTTGGGGGAAGAVFELAPPSTAGGAWTETVLYTFTGGPGGQNVYPNGGVLIGPGGTLYTTAQGTPYGGLGSILGAVGALMPPATQGGAWTEYVLYTFSIGGGSQAAQPLAGLMSEGGALFGTTWSGGDINCSVFGCGVVFELTPPVTHGSAWTETTIHSFTGPPGDGGGPQAALTVGPGGVLYGTTVFGGSGGTPCVYNPYLSGSGCGAVFQLTPPSTPGGTWTESVIYNFTGSDGDGAYPTANVVVDENGVLYGTTQYGGSATSGSPCSNSGVLGCGTVFELTPPATQGGAWTEKVLHSFSGQNGDGSIPVAGLALSSTGVLYGTTSAGGIAGKGTVFAIKP